MLTISQQEFSARRQRLMAQLPAKSIVLIPSAKEILRNGFDNEFTFRQNSDFWYLTGFHEPEAVLVLMPGHADGEVIFFNRPSDSKAEVWTGKRAGQQGVREHFGADQSFPIQTLEEKLPHLLKDKEQVYYPLGRKTEFDLIVIAAISGARAAVRRGAVSPDHVHNIEPLLHGMRLLKSEQEIALMQKANDISSEAHRRIMRACRPGMHEYELEAVMRGYCYSQGCRDMAYSPIVGSAENACVLHYVANNAVIKERDLVLVDAGGEYQHYASDITRTFPANGRFQGEQKAVYEVVLATQQTLLESIKPGVNWDVIQQTCRRSLTEGLVALGILHGSADELIAKEAHLPFYMHLFGHWLGLDTHDAGSYKFNGAWPTLQPNMVFTVEPGLYISAQTPGVDPRWWNIGVRIEDNVVVTPQGHHNLTTAPKTVADIETWMRG